jgi:hypothetical protein
MVTSRYEMKERDNNNTSWDLQHDVNDLGRSYGSIDDTYAIISHDLGGIFMSYVM